MKINSKVVAVLLLSMMPFIGVSQNSYGDKSRVVQFDVTALLTGRAVTTAANKKLVTWNQGVDGSWSGLATRAAADMMGSKNRVAFPNNGVFAPTAFHPLVVMNFSNDDSTGKQVRYTEKNVKDVYSFKVPQNYYSHISLYFMSAYGTSSIAVEISYTDGSSETKVYEIEDWASRIKESDTKYFLSADLAKWGNQNTELEADSHFLIGINIKPLAVKKVSKVTISKPAAETTLTFWGATGYLAATPAVALGNSSNVLYEGRTFVTPNSSVLLGYPGITIRVNFTGSSLVMNANTSSEELYLDVIVDGKEPSFLKVPKGTSDVVVYQGVEGVHDVEIHKRVESSVGVLEVRSFTSSGKFGMPIALPQRKLMFLGDSFTTGQATTVEDGHEKEMDPSKAIRPNARLSYGRLLADRFHAQCHIIGYAGRGVVRDWQGVNTVDCAPQYYERIIPEDPQTQWDPKNYQPDAIGVCLGNNDFGVGIPDQNEYIVAYTEFIKKLQRDAPNAHIFLISSPSLIDEPGKIPMHSVQLGYLKEIVRRLNSDKVSVAPISQYAGVPNDWHPSGTAHRLVAKELEPLFKNALGWE